MNAHKALHKALHNAIHKFVSLTAHHKAYLTGSCCGQERRKQDMAEFTTLRKEYAEASAQCKELELAFEEAEAARGDAEREVTRVR